MDNKSITMRTHDFGLAVALVSNGFEMTLVSRNIYGRYYFSFKQVNKLEQAVNAYWANTLKVYARGYNENTKLLKNLMYAEN
jgi:hypothetical protein